MQEMQSLVEMHGISKSFGGVKALQDVHFDLKPGEIHALMGENGAGKSTLIKILSGAYTKDSGTIKIDGKELEINDTKVAKQQGISVIYQEFALAKDLTVAENIYIDHMGMGKNIINWKVLRRKTRELLDQLGFSIINENARVGDLPVAFQQVVEICKSLSRQTKIMVLDEPTAVLTTNEVEKLFELILNLKKQGVGIIYVSHRLEEIFRISDRITVFKDGTYVDTVQTAQTNEHQLVNMMIGREIEDYFPKRNAKIGEVIFEVKNIKSGNAVKDVSFQVHAGEVLGLSGLVGAGRTETARAIFGADKKDSGEVYLKGKKLSIHTPKEAVKQHIGFLLEDRKNQGVLLEQSGRVNITMASLKDYTKALGIIDKKAEKEKVQSLIDALHIKIDGQDALVNSLSGGNQQKVSFAKWIASDPEVLILDEPTRGVDVGAKIEIYNIINRLAEEGKAIVMISSEMAEIIGMCDRSLVMREGVVTGELSRDELTEENLIKLSMGVM